MKGTSYISHDAFSQHHAVPSLRHTIDDVDFDSTAVFWVHGILWALVG